MNRCIKPLITRVFIAAGALFISAGVLFPSPSWAERSFPKDAKRAEMNFVDFPNVLIDGQPERLPHSVRVRDESNSILMPYRLRKQVVIVNYLRNKRDEIDQVWILSAQEATVPLKPKITYSTKPMTISSDALPSYTN
jgi:hypothetical protein